jgi:hypothetical protein
VFKQGTGWSGGPMIDMGTVGVTTSLKIDSHDIPHIAYYDNTMHLLKYGVMNGTSWNVLNLDPGSADRGGYATLALDANDNPHIAYLEQAGSITLKYAH